MFAVSFVSHLVVFLVITYWYSAPEFYRDDTPVTYVDMVTLPVAAPQSGTPAPAADTETPASVAPPPPPAAPPAAAAPAMKQPVKPSAKPVSPDAVGKGQPEKSAAETREFQERLAKLEQLAQDRRQAEVLDRLRKKGGSTRTGMPGGKGTEAGSDYPSYLQSRLQDALQEVMVSQTKAPQVIATITIAPDGRIADYHVEKGSGDPLFDDAVRRAVTLAGKSLVPPPGGAQFRRVFRFMPERVGIR